VTINDLVNAALVRWIALTGLVDEGGRTKVAPNCPWEPWTVRSYAETLNESRTLDKTGLTTFMLVRGLTEAYLKDIKVSAHDLILDPAAIEAQLGPMRALRDALEEPEVVQMIADFQKQLRDGAVHYGVEPGEPMAKLEELVASRYALARVRRDALISMERLQAHQFTQGVKEEKPPKYSPDVFEFWNINSMLSAMRSQKSGGISLCLIRDPEQPLRSYFAFAIRNGGTLTVLTDKSDEPHPAFKRMTRRPDRALETRASQHWFPYQLLDLTTLGKGAEERVVAARRTQLVPMNVEAVPLSRLSALEPEQFVWLMLVFDMIRERFWAEDKRLPEISYTGQMIAEPQALVGASGALVKDGLYKPLELPSLKAADLTDKVLRSQWGRTPTHFNRWLVERYKDQVPEEALNPVGESAKALLTARSQEPGFLPTVVRTKRTLMKRWEERQQPRFETMDATAFGTKKELVRDRLWVGRMNQCAIVQQLADAEFEKDKDSVCAWYTAAIRKNKKAIFDACARGEWMMPRWLPSQFAMPGRSKSVIATKNVVDQWMSKRGYSARTTFRFGETRTSPRYWVACAEKPNLKASIITSIDVTCPQALAVVCGVDVEELPWPLQNWFDEEPYVGNSILDRIEPSDWKIKNPWREIDFSVVVAQSKTAYHARRQALGLARQDVSKLRAK